MASMSGSGDGRTGRRGPALAFVALLLVTLAACGAPGSKPARTGSNPGAVSTGVGSAPVTLQMRVNTDLKKLMDALAAGFHAKYPNVTVKITDEDFESLRQDGPRLIAADNPPDLIRFPSPGTAVKDGLLLNLDAYAKAYRWDEYSPSQLAQFRFAADGKQRGTGSLYGMGLGFGVTGVYYNKKLAATLGITRVPATLPELAADAALANSAGDTPFMGAGNSAFLFQALWMDYVGAKPVADWTFSAPGATIDTPEAARAAFTVQQWAKNKYYPKDFLAIDETSAFTRFLKGNALFYYSGNWSAAGLDQAAPGDFGFFPFPPATAGGKYAAMSAPNSYVIPAKAKHADVAAAFLDWANTSTEARDSIVKLGSLAAGGPSNLPVPNAPPGSAFAQTLTVFQKVSDDDGLVAFLADTTATMLPATLNPQTQLLVSGKVSPQAYVKKIQADYESGLGR